MLSSRTTTFFLSTTRTPHLETSAHTQLALLTVTLARRGRSARGDKPGTKKFPAIIRTRKKWYRISVAARNESSRSCLLPLARKKNRKKKELGSSRINQQQAADATQSDAAQKSSLRACGRRIYDRSMTPGGTAGNDNIGNNRLTSDRCVPVSCVLFRVGRRDRFCQDYLHQTQLGAPKDQVRSRPKKSVLKPLRPRKMPQSVINGWRRKVIHALN